MSNGTGLRLDVADSGRSERASPVWRLVASSSSSLVVLADGSGGFPFYCVHSVAGDIAGYADLALALGPAQRFCGLQVGKADMSPAFAASVEAIARRHVETVILAQPAGPLAVGGFSAGAIIALEMAAQLRDAGRDVALLVILDGAPNNTGATLSRSDPRYLLHLLRNVPRWLASEEWRDWSPRAISSRLFNRFVYRATFRRPVLKDVATTRADVVLGLLDRPNWQASQRQFIGAMFNAICDYVPKPYDGAVVVYESQAQPLFHHMQVAAVWRTLAPQAEIVPVPGKHQSFFRAMTIGPLATHLRARLAAL